MWKRRRSRRQDPGLDEFREGIAILRDGGEIVGHVATTVERMWAPFRWGERVWLLVTWVDGSRERIEEDYAPWSLVSDLRDGHLVWETAAGARDFTAEWLHGDERASVWATAGILEDVARYM